MRNDLRQFFLISIISVTIFFIWCGRPVNINNKIKTILPDTIINSYQPDTISQLNKANEDSIILSPKCFDIKLTTIKKLNTIVFIKDFKGRQISKCNLVPNIETKVIQDIVSLARGVYWVEVYDNTGLIWITQFVNKGNKNIGR